MNLVLADAAVIAGGFADSLRQALASPWMLAVPGALLMLGASAWLGRRSRRMPFPREEAGDVQDCLWCTPRNGVIDSALCTCTAPCVQSYCKARAVTVDG